jgi:DNA-binding IclR family transcriptional regulator
VAELKYQVYRVIDHLQNREAYTCADLASELNMHVRTAQRHLKELYMLDLVYICGWDKEYQQTVPVYKWGNKADVPRPTALTWAQRAKRNRERKNANRSSVV